MSNQTDKSHEAETWHALTISDVRCDQIRNAQNHVRGQMLYNIAIDVKHIPIARTPFSAKNTEEEKLLTSHQTDKSHEAQIWHASDVLTINDIHCDQKKSPK
jgi:hypothetical protein